MSAADGTRDIRASSGSNRKSGFASRGRHAAHCGVSRPTPHPSGSNAVDLVITADIPLMAAALEKGAYVLDPRGSWFMTSLGQEAGPPREIKGGLA